jgi:hypothetical protein
MSGIRLFAHPRPAGLADYARAAREIEARLDELPGRLAVYRVGAVSDPGISDLDRIVVVSDRRRVPAIWPDLSERTRTLAMHTPFIVDEETFASHKLISYLEPLELVSGVAVDVEEPLGQECTERLLAAESLLLNLLRVLKSMVTGRLKVRATLCQLHTVRYGLRLAGVDRSEAGLAWALTDEIRLIRSTWFTASDRGDHEQRLRNAMARALPAIVQALDALASRLPVAASGVAGRLRLGDSWSNITLMPADRRPTPIPELGGRFSGVLASRSSKAAEARWRVKRYNVLLPPEVLLILSGAGPSDCAVIWERRVRVLARYAEFLSVQPRGYSSIALGPAVRSR